MSRASASIPRSLALATDLYELTMAAAYHANDRHERATFELFARHLPPERSYLVVAGLQQAVDYMASLRFQPADIDFLRGLPVFARVPGAFFDYLAGFRFTGEAWAMPEGTVAFAGEPLLEVRAPLIEAQVLETYLLATVNFQTLIATKAARVVEAARDRGVIEFGGRRAHGMEAALFAARAAYIGGCIGTSNVEAAYHFGIPVYGTAAHSWTMAFDQEMDAFKAYYRVFPESTTLLLDTYDTIRAAHLATAFGASLRGVRLDSGDMTALSKQVRAILDAAGMTGTKILASGDLNEYKIAAMLEQGAPIDLFGVGTDLSTSRDAPALSGVYKLVELETPRGLVPKIKLSADKATYPFRKQVWRRRDASGRFAGDVIAMAEEQYDEAAHTPLLKQIMKEGRCLEPLPDVHAAREHALRQREGLPARYASLAAPETYPVRYSDLLDRHRRGIENHSRGFEGCTDTGLDNPG
jgi:nicotinate phosphoribosyltransferase